MGNEQNYRPNTTATSGGQGAGTGTPGKRTRVEAELKRRRGTGAAPAAKPAVDHGGAAASPARSGHGTGFADAVRVDPPSLAFATVVGRAAVPQSVSIDNPAPQHGDEPAAGEPGPDFDLRMTATITPEGDGAGPFSVPDPGFLDHATDEGPYQLPISFSPTGAGDYEAILALHFVDRVRPTRGGVKDERVALHGTALPAPAHQPSTSENAGTAPWGPDERFEPALLDATPPGTAGAARGALLDAADALAQLGVRYQEHVVPLRSSAKAAVAHIAAVTGQLERRAMQWITAQNRNAIAPLKGTPGDAVAKYAVKVGVELASKAPEAEILEDLYKGYELGMEIKEARETNEKLDKILEENDLMGDLGGELANDHARDTIMKVAAMFGRFEAARGALFGIVSGQGEVAADLKLIGKDLTQIPSGASRSAGDDDRSRVAFGRANVARKIEQYNRAFADLLDAYGRLMGARALADGAADKALGEVMDRFLAYRAGKDGKQKRVHVFATFGMPPGDPLSLTIGEVQYGSDGRAAMSDPLFQHVMAKKLDDHDFKGLDVTVTLYFFGVDGAVTFHQTDDGARATSETGDLDRHVHEVGGYAAIWQRLEREGLGGIGP